MKLMASSLTEKYEFLFKQQKKHRKVRHNNTVSLLTVPVYKVNSLWKKSSHFIFL